MTVMQNNPKSPIRTDPPIGGELGEAKSEINQFETEYF